ncbi:MAG: hypothetical protein Q9166_004028 [cf. Caloplaca sp. 2 TL-2023]
MRKHSTATATDSSAAYPDAVDSHHSNNDEQSNSDAEAFLSHIGSEDELLTGQDNFGSDSEFYTDLARLQKAARIYSANPSNTAYRALEIAQKSLLGLKREFDIRQAHNKQLRTIHPSIDDDALNALYSHMVIEQTVWANRDLLAIRKNLQVRDFRIGLVREWHGVLILNPFSNRTLKALGVLLTGVEQENPCQQVSTPESRRMPDFYKVFIAADIVGLMDRITPEIDNPFKCLE